MKTLRLLILLFFAILFSNCSNKKRTKPTVYVVGDSTVKNGKGDGAQGLWGWGDFIDHFLDSTKIKLENYALGGTSTRTYQNLGLWDTVNNKLKKGDYVLIQFGHNDNGPINDTFRARGTIQGIGTETKEVDNMITGEHEIVHSYGWYLEKMVIDTKAKGAVPIIMSPIPKNKWVGFKIPRNKTSYGLWAKQIAEKNEIAFIDLNDKMASYLEDFGEAKVTGTYFYNHDHTHTTAKGALIASSIIIDELKAVKSSLTNYFISNPKIVLPKKKNVFLIGDSTMANNNNANAVGWGVPFLQFCDTTQINLLNKARGGRSSRTYIFEGLWDKVKAKFQKNDIVFIQFGHNDADYTDKKKYRGSLKGIGEDTQIVTRDSIKEIVHTFGWYLRKMINETKEKGAIPVILSLTPRNEWTDGKVEQRDSTYIKWAEEVANNQDAVFIDFSNIIAEKYQQLGKEKIKYFFPKDSTHTGLEGANFTALAFAEVLIQSEEIGLSSCVFTKN